jgi:hypothetical protein
MLNPPLSKDAFALRPDRFLVSRNEIRYYDATTFPDGPFAGCSLYLRRCLGNLIDDGSGLQIDVLAQNGDIIQEYPINRQGFSYLRRVLRFRVEVR